MPHVNQEVVQATNRKASDGGGALHNAEDLILVAADITSRPQVSKPPKVVSRPCGPLKQTTRPLTRGSVAKSKDGFDSLYPSPKAIRRSNHMYVSFDLMYCPVLISLDS